MNLNERRGIKVNTKMQGQFRFCCAYFTIGSTFEKLGKDVMSYTATSPDIQINFRIKNQNQIRKIQIYKIQKKKKRLKYKEIPSAFLMCCVYSGR